MRELSLHLLDILENAREAGATEILVEIREDSARDELVIRVVDDGRGIPNEVLQRVFDPFFTTRQTRHVGLGLPLLKAAAERAGGSASVVSGCGCTEVTARFQHSHIDRAPLGDVAGSLIAALLGRRGPRLRYSHWVNGKSFTLDSDEVSEALGGIDLGHPSVGRWLQTLVGEEIRSLRVGMAP